MDKAVDARTKAIVINNPSNPCGSNFTAEHLLQIASIARKHNLPIIADEIYGKCVFNGSFYPMHLYSEDVPVISLSG
jgi:tyrosine aminotransferase